MYLLRKIYSNQMDKSLTIKKGMECVKIDKNYILKDSFWGRTKIFGGIFAEKHDKPFLMEYVNEYYPNPANDGYIELTLNYSSYDPNNIDGYIIFLKNEEDINTTGQILWSRYYFEAIIVLKEGESLDFSGYHIEVKDSKVLLS